MDKIISPLKQGMQGVGVANLQDALLLLLEKAVLLVDSAVDRGVAMEQLKNERVLETFGKMTSRLVARFQEERKLPVSGAVDAATAEAINALLRELGALDDSDRPEDPVEEDHFFVQGVIRDSERSAVVGVQVVAFDFDVGGEDRLGEAVTDADGAYYIAYDEAGFRRSAGERGGADVQIRVYDETAQLLGKSKVMHDAPARLRLDLILNDEYVIAGVVVDRAGAPLAGMRVIAVDKDLRKEQLLGAASTSAQGAFRIRYSRRSFARAERGHADVTVRVFDPQSSTALLELILPAGQDPASPLTLVVGEAAQQLSEYERIADAIRPLLAGQGPDDVDLPLYELLASDVDFLVRETELETELVAKFVAAQSAARSTRSVPPILSHASERPEFALPPEFFYAQHRAHQGADGRNLFLQSRSELERALDWSLSAAIIPAAFADPKDALLDAWDRWRGPRFAEESSVEGIPLQSVLAALGADFPPDLHQRMLLLAARRGRLSADVVDVLEQDDSLSSSTRTSLAQLRQAIAFADAAAGDAALFEAMRVAAPENETIAQPQDVVRFSLAQWQKVAAVLPAADDQPSADELMRRFDGRYLSASALLRIERGEIPISPAARIALNQLRASQPGLALAGRGEFSLVQALRDTGKDGAVASQAATELLQLDSMLSASGSAIDVADMSKAGFRSVADVLDAGRQSFVGTMTNREGQVIERPWLGAHANAVFDSIGRAGAAGAIAGIAPHVRDRTPLVAALGSQDNAGGEETLASLGATEHQCACPQCRSVLSLSAYLADLLVFLRDARQLRGQSVLDVLRRRRPDIEEVLLHCDNEQTELSYVELVNEVLERAVATGSDPDWLHLAQSVTSTGALVSELNQGSLPALLCEELAAAGVRLGQNVRVVVLTKNILWQIRDPQWVVYLNKRPPASVFDPGPRGFHASPWPQSDGATTADASARHLLHAYAVLAESVYPWSLPFELPELVIRSALACRGISEPQLREVFQSGSAQRAAVAAARVRFGLPSHDNDPQNLSDLASEEAIAACWGFGDIHASAPDPSPQFGTGVRPAITGWKAILARLSFFLERSGLEHAEAVSLLASDFINPDGTLKIEAVDPADPASCDPRKLQITGIAQVGTLLAVYRFVRLMRATRLTIPELDRLLTAVAAPNWPLTVDRVALALQINERLKLPITALAALWTDLGTRRYPDVTGTQARTLPSSYDMVFRSTPALMTRLPADPVAAAAWPDYGQLRDQLPQALGIGSQDVEPMLALAGLSMTTPSSLAGLSALYRHAMLIQASGASIADFIRFRSLLSEAPFTVEDIPALQRSLDRWDLFSAWSRAGFDIVYALGGDSAAAAEHETRIASAASILADQLATPSRESDDVREQRIVVILSDLCGLDVVATRELAGRRLVAPADWPLAADSQQWTILRLINSWSDWPADGVTPSADNCALIFNALTLIHKVAILLAALSPSRNHWDWIFNHAAGAGWLELPLIPIDNGDNTASFESLEKLARWTRFWATAAAGDDSELATAYFGAVTAGDRVEANRMLGKAIGISASDIDLLLGTESAPGSWAPDFPADYFDAQLAQRLSAAGVLMQRLRIAPAKLAYWLQTDLVPFPERMLRAEAMRSAIFASLDATDRTRVEQEHSRILSDACRSALVALLLHREQLAHTGELLARYLIDVDMASTQRSTRTAQAVFAIQLFIQRVLLNLEPGVQLSEADAAQWNQWRKWYRVWEANRKVFLYPENWLEPEFRDDKSAFFHELESDLEQSDLTSERAVTAFSTYLDKLGQVSRLELVAMHNEKDEHGRTVTHLFARTRSAPVSYYYRQRIKDFRWTAWEKIDVDVEGDFLIPVIHGKQMQLVWAIINGAPGSASQSASRSRKVQFARSRRSAGGWTPKQLVGQAFSVPEADSLISESFLFRSVPDASGDIRIVAFAFKNGMLESSLRVIPGSVWKETPGLRCTPSGVVMSGDFNANAAVVAPTDSYPSGMGYRPRRDILHLSRSEWSHGIQVSVSGDVLLLGSADHSGLAPWTTSLSVELGFDTPFAISTAEGSYLGDADVWEQSAFPGGSDIRPMIAFESVHYSSDSRLFDAWARLPSPATILPQLQTGSGSISMPDTFAVPTGSKLTVALIPDGVDFDQQRANSAYNWEIFLHIPWTVARRLSENRRYAEAQNWYHSIFDPTLGRDQEEDDGLAAWRCRPIRAALQKNESVLDLLADRNKLAAQVQEWEEHPFQPHALARYRIRAYAVAIVKDYIRNLLAWGDDIARRNTLEAVNEATQLYVLAQGLLGPRPSPALVATDRKVDTFSRLDDFDPLSNPAAAELGAGVTIAAGSNAAAVPKLNLRYFCVPANDELLDLWAQVEARLQRVRAGALGSLFGPPIDPAILVRAAAAGLDIADILADLFTPTVPYRYAVMVQKAMQACSEVKSLGAALLAAIEKKDGEELTLLRTRHERTLARMQRDIRSRQIDEARVQLQLLHTTRASAVERLRHFRVLLNHEDLAAPEANIRVTRIEPITVRSSEPLSELDTRQLGLSRREVAYFQLAEKANTYALWASSLNGTASLLHLIPDETFKLPLVDTKFGGSNLGFAANAASAVLQTLATHNSYKASTSATVTGHERRRDEWAYQHNLIAAEIEQLDQQIEAASLRAEIAAAELDYQIRMEANAAETEEYLRGKFSSSQLYHWMIRQLSGAYFRSYQMALELARAAQKAYEHELATDQASEFIQSGYWDNLREGLLSGEQLALDLARMDAEYLRNNQREYEITRNISLALLDPLALIQLRLTGKCTFQLPEVLFDIDFPGHYLRRVKSVSVSLPCVTGPYASISGTLTLDRSYTRKTQDFPPGLIEEDSARPVMASIAVSHGQADSGMFEPNLRDDRYLPFEGAGVADSVWEFVLSSDFRSFDYDTIADLVLHVRYTARKGEAGFAKHIGDQLKSALNELKRLDESEKGLWRMFSLKHEFASLWAALSAANPPPRTLALGSDYFGALLRNSTLKVEEIRGFAMFKNSPVGTDSPTLTLGYKTCDGPRSLVLIMDQPAGTPQDAQDTGTDSLYDRALQGGVMLGPGQQPSISGSAGLELTLEATNMNKLDELLLCMRVSLA